MTQSIAPGGPPRAVDAVRFTTHTQVMVIALIVLTVMFFMSYYYTVTEERSFQLERLQSKESYISRLLTQYLSRADAANNPRPLKTGLDILMNDEDVAYLRVLTAKSDLQSMKQGFRPELTLRKTIPLFNDRAQPVGQLVIGFWNSPRSEAGNRLNLINMIIVVDILVLFGLALHLLLKEIVTRPLENFVDATKRIAQGDFESYLERPFPSMEQERLAVNFNNMLDHLRDYRDRLQRINEELEARVQTRTEQFRREKGRSEAILTSVADGVYTIDADWRIVTFNPAAEKITGVPARDAIGQECWSVLKYPFCKTNCLLKRLPRENRDAETEIYVEEFEKRGASFIVSGAPLFDGGGGRVGGVESIKDITYVKQLHDQIRQADKLSSIGILAAGVAHEINNPLSNIKLYSQILKEELDNPADTVRTSLANISQETDRATRIVRNLLEFSRQGIPEFVRTELKAVVDQAVDMLRHQLSHDRVSVSVQLPGMLPAIWADRGNLQQVFVNLMTNARHAMQPAGGTLHIRAWHESVTPRVMISFADTGCGIAPENLDRIFDPFFTTKEVGQGTGLGLAISYGIIKDHGGDIRVRSRPGEGAEFVISLPTAI